MFILCIVDHQSVLTCSRDDTLRNVDLRSCRVVQSMSAPGFKVSSDYSRATIAPDGAYAAAGSMVCFAYRHSAHLCSAAGLIVLYLIPVIVYAQDGSLFVWNAASGRPERCLSKEHTAPVLAVDWHPRGAELVSVDRGRHAVLWTDI